MSVKMPEKAEEATKKTSPCRIIVPPRNPNKRPTNINMERSIGRMKAEDRAVIQRSL
ncbi:hypothetical protein [Sporosarcina sp. NPDC096371]|uniref:hypothetical protein n=1 Tax=Sporosarcina sp. NPDC096371 TaxID=3364530 RepID=UPI00381F53DE